MSKDILKQTFNSTNVNLEITSFKSMKYWTDIMESNDIKDIWSFIRWLMPDDVFNIHNYQKIEKKFFGIPSRKRILDFISEDPNLFYLIRLNLNNPALGCHIYIYDNKQEVIESQGYRNNKCILANGKLQFVLQDYTNPMGHWAVSLVTQFNFYEEFNTYVMLGNANKGKRIFFTREDGNNDTDKMSIMINAKIDWRGISFENSIPVKDRNRSKYHVIGERLKVNKNKGGFYEVFQALKTNINCYIKSANNDLCRIAQATRFIPIVYTEADKIMRELRTRFTRLQVITADMEQIFVPYLEIGASKYDFVFGVISR